MSGIESGFKALADQTRREILYLLAVTPSGIPMIEIADQFSATRQGIAKHIKILEKAGLIEIRLAGRERKCFLNPLPLQPIMDWLEFYRPYWSEKINTLDSQSRDD